MVSKIIEESRFSKPWARSLRKGRCLLGLVLSLVFLTSLRHLYRGGYISIKNFGFQDPLWSYPYLNASDTAFPPHAPAYIVFEPRTSFPPLNEPLKQVGELPSYCLDASIASGQLCHAGPDPPLDIVWTWVNGSDRLVRDAMAVVRSPGRHIISTSQSSTQFFRDHDELRHSVRSVLKHFRSHTTRMHIVTSDFPIKIPIMDNDKLYSGTRRLGLAPRWLDPKHPGKWRDGDVTLGLIHHSDIFKFRHNVSSFNSYGIETQLENMQGISENFIYMNDDFFMMANLSASDFYTSSYGTVLRMQSDLLVNNNENPRTSVGGEWGPLEYTNWILSRRFGSRRRPYTTHAAKSLSISLLKELSRMWQSELEVTASHTFRGMKDDHWDVYSMFLFSHFLVERWREGLLWSWAVGKIGGVDGQWDKAEKERAWQELGGQPGQRVIQVLTTERTTVDDAVVRENLKATGHTTSGKTTYAFASGDGYPYEYRNSKGKFAWPSFSPELSGQLLCKIDYHECFGQPGASASDLFKTIAFEKGRGCGDCIVHALRAASGVKGLAMFLPDIGRNHTAKRDESTGEEDIGNRIPHLPLVSEWQKGDFSLHGVIYSEGEVNIREWTLRMLQRYRFVIGQTPTLFHQISSATAARIKLKKVDEDKDAALLCLNDDIRVPSKVANQILLAWQEEKWGNKAEWER